MLELLLCAAVTILPDFLYRRFFQGKRLGSEITLFSVWYELRWGITLCLILTIALITTIFYFHPWEIDPGEPRLSENRLLIDRIGDPGLVGRTAQAIERPRVGQVGDHDALGLQQCRADGLGGAASGASMTNPDRVEGVERAGDTSHAEVERMV